MFFMDDSQHSQRIRTLNDDKDFEIMKSKLKEESGEFHDDDDDDDDDESTFFDDTKKLDVRETLDYREDRDDDDDDLSFLDDDPSVIEEADRTENAIRKSVAFTTFSLLAMKLLSKIMECLFGDGGQDEIVGTVAEDLTNYSTSNVGGGAMAAQGQTQA